MRVHALAAVATVLVHLSSAVSGLVYVCELDGQARGACCCPRDERLLERTDVSFGCCCDISVVEPNAVAGVSEKRALAGPAPALSAVPGIALAAPSGDLATRFPSRDSSGARRGGPPLYLEIRTLII